MSSSTSFGSGIFNSGGLGSAPFFNVSSLIDGILYATGHSTPANETTKRRAILQYVNNSYQDICIGQHWRWLIASYDMNLAAKYETGTVSVTQGDQTVTGDGTVWSTNITEKSLFWIDGSSQTYHVSSITSTTQLELESKYSEDTGTEIGYTIAQNQYELPKETDKILGVTVDNSGTRAKLRPKGLPDFRTLQASDPTRVGAPLYFTYARRETDDDSVYMEVWPTPEKRYNVHIDYSVRILYLEDSVDCYPIIPDRYRSVLYFGALAQFLAFFQNDMVQAQAAQSAYLAMLLRMKQDKELTDQKPRIDARGNYRKRRRGRGGYTYTEEEFGKLD